MKQQFLEDKTGTLRLSVYEDNRPIIPSEAKVTLYNPAGSELQAQDDGSVDADTGEMTYSLTATHTATVDTNYKAVWEYVVSGTTYYQIQLYDVVKSILSIPITDADLYAELDALREQHFQETGTADSGTASTLVDANRNEKDNFWKGGQIEIISGTGSGQKHDITAFTQSTGTFTVDPDWDTNPDTTSIYKVIKSFTTKIEHSFEEIEDMLYDKGNRAALILESSQIKFAIIYLTVSKICQDLADEVDDKWDRLATTYYERYLNKFSNMKLEYDEDETGFIEGEEEGRKPNTLRLFRA